MQRNELNAQRNIALKAAVMYYLLLLEVMPIIYLDSAAFTVSISFSYFFIISFCAIYSSVKRNAKKYNLEYGGNALPKYLL